jgi:putative phosphoribosyl transferase
VPVSAPETVSLPFADRSAAGRLLGARLLRMSAVPASGLSLARAVVLALPRGGVPVGREVSMALGVPLDVLVTRKIGYPPQPELGVGAVAEGGQPVFDDEILARLGLTPAALAPVVSRELAELGRRIAVYRGGRPAVTVRDRDVIVTDDGLATGVTARAALRAVRAAGARRTILAVPVAAPSSAAAMLAEADLVVVLAAPAAFRAVGEWYQSFDQLRDADVIRLMAAGAGPGRIAPGPGGAMPGPGTAALRGVGPAHPAAPL